MLRLLDKIFFTAILLLVLQVPQLVEQYQQYLAGYLDATGQQIADFEENASLNGYPSVYAMIAEHQRNTTASVRTDAEQKLAVLADHELMSEGMVVMQTGNLIEKLVYIFSPQRLDMLKGMMVNFEPGIPLSPSVFIFALIFAVLFNLLCTCPVYVYKWRKNKKHKALLAKQRFKSQF